MDFVDTLITQGGLGLMAGIFMWLYLQERKEHKETRKEKDTLMEARRQDAKEVTENLSAPLQNIAQGIAQLNDKIVVAQNRGSK